jgi:hypothetical protein
MSYKIALLLSALLLSLAVVGYQYLSPYNSCVRGLIKTDVPERIALLRCKGA